MIKATSKNTGIAMINPVILSAIGDFSTPNIRNKVEDNFSVAPLSRKISPKIAPKPMTIAI